MGRSFNALLSAHHAAASCRAAGGLGDCGTRPGSVYDRCGSRRFESLEVHELRLESLSDTTIEQIAADRLGDAPTPAQQQLLKSAAGNPFFAAELLDGPSRLRERIAGRVSSLSDAARTVVHLGSVFGRPFTVEELRAASGLEQSTLLGALDDLISEGMLQSEGTAIGFRHDLLRKAVYESIEPPFATSSMVRSSNTSLPPEGQGSKRYRTRLRRGS